MGSRLKQDPGKIFEVFIEFVREPNGGEGQGRMVRFYPKDFDDQEVLKPSVKFAFPRSHGRHSLDEEHFTFVLTDINSKFKFGFCKLTSGPPERNYCFISCLPWFDSFYSLLDEVSSRLLRHEHDAVFTMLGKLYEATPSSPSVTIGLAPLNWNEKFNFIRPTKTTGLPSIPQNRNFSELFRTFRTSNLLILFSSMLFERRILMYGSSVARLTSCIHGLKHLIYPMCWQHLFIPILPSSLLDYCSAPMPYIIGLHSSTMLRLQKMEYSDAVLVNVDEDKIHTEHPDLASVPHDVVATLKKQLKLQKTLVERNHNVGDGVARVFLGSMVALIGGYRNAMRFHDGADITFDPDIFVAGASFSKDPSSCHEYKSFFKMILHMQSFQQFINDRLDIMNAGKGFQDAFDKAVITMSGDEDRWKTQSRYKEWLLHMKKHGKMLKREGKDKWTIFAAKVKGKSKKTWKEIKSRLDDMKKEDSTPSQFARKQHYTPQFRPPRPPPPILPKDLRAGVTIQGALMRRSSLERTQHYNLLDVDLLDSHNSFNDSDDALDKLKQVDTNLSNDPDLLPWMLKLSRPDVISDTAACIRKSYSTEGLCNARPPEGSGPRSALDPSATSTGKEGQMNARSLSSANMLNKMLESLDLSSVDSSSTDMPVREAATSDRRLESDLQHMTTSVSYTFKSALLQELPHPGQNRLKSKMVGHRDWSQEDLMEFDSSSSSIEFDPLKQKAVEASYEDDHPKPLPRIKSRNRIFDGNCLSTTPYDDRDGHAALPPPLPFPRKRDATSLQYYQHNRKQPIHTQMSENYGVQYSTDGLLRPRSPAAHLHGSLDVSSSASSCIKENDRTSVATNLKMARAAFLQSDCSVPMSHSGLESFDPLASGQLVLELPSRTLAPTNHQKSDDELLKDWDLNFGTGVTMVVNLPSVSMPNAPHQPAVGLQPMLISLAGFPASNPTMSHPHQYPLEPGNNRTYRTLSRAPIHSNVTPRNTQKSLTLPHGTTLNSSQGGIFLDGSGAINQQVGLGKAWETFD